MSEQVYSQGVSLNDSMERNIMDAALSNGEAVSIVALSKNVFGFIFKKLAAFGSYMLELSDHIQEARAKSERYARSHW